MIDRRRFTLATSTGSPHCPASTRPLIPPAQSSNGHRSATSLRSPLLIKTGAVKGSAGSCYLEHGKSKIICSLSGPRQSTDIHTIGKGALKCTCKYAPYLVASNSGGNGAELSRLESQLERAVEGALCSVVLLDRIPNSLIEISICILDDESASSSCDHLVPDAVNAAVVAVVAAAIEVQDVVSCCQVGLAGSSGIVMDPSASECLNGHCTICYSAVHNEVVQVQVQLSEQVAEQRVKEAVQWAIDGAVAVREVMVKALGK